MSKYLFVYGTLLQEHAPAEMKSTVKQLCPVAPACVRGYLYDLGDYPGAVLDPSADSMISGEIFELPDDESVLASIDSYEDFNPSDPKGSLFVRTTTLAILPDGRELECWIYAYNRNPESSPTIATGRYTGTEADDGQRIFK